MTARSHHDHQRVLTRRDQRRNDRGIDDLGGQLDYGFHPCPGLGEDTLSETPFVLVPPRWCEIPAQCVQQVKWCVMDRCCGRSPIHGTVAVRRTIDTDNHGTTRYIHRGLLYSQAGYASQSRRSWAAQKGEEVPTQKP
jgi:hypothetical protein